MQPASRPQLARTTPEGLDTEMLRRTVTAAVRMLDNVGHRGPQPARLDP